jgi:cytoplasmic tRNA 2-thiolation protein 2
MEHFISSYSDMKAQAPASLRNSTIDILMKQYFDSAEEQYPSIVSNVVRTSGRLHAGLIGAQRCKLCILPVTKDQLGIEGWEGIQEVESRRIESKLELCYGCSRSVPVEALSLLP